MRAFSPHFLLVLVVLLYNLTHSFELFVVQRGCRMQRKKNMFVSCAIMMVYPCLVTLIWRFLNFSLCLWGEKRIVYQFIRLFYTDLAFLYRFGSFCLHTFLLFAFLLHFLWLIIWCEWRISVYIVLLIFIIRPLCSFFFARSYPGATDNFQECVYRQNITP